MRGSFIIASVAFLRRCSLFLIVALALLAGCMRLASIDKTPIKTRNTVELQDYLRTHKADLELFRLRGPFEVALEKNHELRLSGGERISTDLFLSAPAEKAPLVIFLHGYDSSKE